MKYLVRKDIDVTKPVSLKSLNSFTKISTAFRYAWANTQFAQKKASDIETVEQRKRAAMREHVKGELSKMLYEWFSEKSNTEELTFIINSELFDTFKSVCEDIEYSAFQFIVERENYDMRLLDSSRPYVCRVTRRQING